MTIIGITPQGVLTLEEAYADATRRRRLIARVRRRPTDAHLSVEVHNRGLQAASARPGVTCSAEVTLGPPEARALAFALAPELADLLRVIAEGQATPDTRRLALRLLADQVRPL